MREDDFILTTNSFSRYSKYNLSFKAKTPNKNLSEAMEMLNISSSEKIK